ncbi:hypothetical protein LCGC14_1024780 [marine sediment metagenome]|uniref:ParB/Sulfiredoxin domain-containing protein n=1 Tax=marine sediment metagenome TaxID=412755 RepID=A0A0F9NI11_9ZZZZ
MATLKEPTIDEEFAALLPALTDEEREGLRVLLIEQGWLGTIKVWKGIVLDGRHRLDICKKYGIHYKTEEVKLPDRDAAKAWIIRHARGQRNLTPDQQSYLRGQQLLLEKKPEGRPSKQLPQNEGVTAERLAEEHQVSRATIERDAMFACDVNLIFDKAGPKAKQDVLSGGLELTKKDVAAIAQLPPAKLKKAIEGGKDAVKKAVAPAKAKPEVDYPVSAKFLNWLGSLSAFHTSLRTQHKTIAALLKTKGWQKSETTYAAELLDAVTHSLTTLNKEMQEHVKHNGK